MTKPVAVLISDIHFNIITLEIASQALRQAVTKANSLRIPLIIAGDLHDTKANLRGECLNAITDILADCSMSVYILRGNHDSLNEKSKESSVAVLRYMEDTIVVEKPHFYNELGSINGRSIHLIPYYHNVEELRQYLKIRVDKGSTIIMHQGIEDSHSGEYIQDKSALSHEDVKDFRVISGHYHRRQDIKTGRPRQGALGLFSYIGNPFSLNFGEASDPEKGYQILMSDGLLEFVPTNLRNHVIIEVDLNHRNNAISYSVGDILLVRIRGTAEQLLHFKKEDLGISEPYRLDLIPLETNTTAEIAKDLTQDQTLDSLIDSLTNTSDERKANLKELWRRAVSG